MTRRRGLRILAWTLGIVGGLVVAAIAGILIWSQVGVSQAEPEPLAAVRADDRIVITDDPAGIVLAPADGESDVGLVFIPGGKFSMGAAQREGMSPVGMQATHDSRPIHRVSVGAFWMDATEVTNEQFARFVEATGYVTVSERTPRAEDYPGAPPENLVAGSIVFTPPDRQVPLDNHFQWWGYVKGADWRHPTGPTSSLKGREKHPVEVRAGMAATIAVEWKAKK